MFGVFEETVRITGALPSPEISGVFEFLVRDGLIAPGLHCTMVDLLAAQFPASSIQFPDG